MVHPQERHLNSQRILACACFLTLPRLKIVGFLAVLSVSERGGSGVSPYRGSGPVAIKSILILTSDGTPPPLDLQSIQDGFDTLILSTTKVGSLRSPSYGQRHQKRLT